jgi:hypothetical protein
LRLGHLTIGLGSLSTAIAAMAVSGSVGVILVASLAGVMVVLVAVLVVTGTFGKASCRSDAQTVLAILLGRRYVRPVSSTRQPARLRGGR